ncbi:MAG: hypothetical protein FWD27_04895 [Coriobacteriia bacterium]|nr:hypothetical protein [Coriobacteriia bacterium]
MFFYWDGYEIDGSDTSFDIIVPESIQVRDLVESFLAIPLFCEKRKPVYNTLPPMSYNRGHVEPEKRLSKAEFEEQLYSGSYPLIGVMAYCKYPEQLSTALQSELYCLSKERAPLEKGYQTAQSCCTEPASKVAFMTVDLTLERVVKEGDLRHREPCLNEGAAYSYNISLSTPVKKGDTWVTLGIPVSSNYEYTRYIIKYLEERFPSIRIWGGAECSCGATFGSSLYAYEKIQLPVKHSVKHSLKWLMDYGIVRSSVSYYEKGWTSRLSKSGLFLQASREHWSAPPEEELPFSSYLELVDLTLSLELETVEQIFETAAIIALPPPELYENNPEIVAALEARLDEIAPYEERQTWYRKDWLYPGYIAFALIDNKPTCELRVRSEMKGYLLSLLEYAESGQLEFVKPQVYEWRNE